ncbi:hypothetical protein [Blautia sp. 1033sp1_1033st1_G9_1033SCRN_220408]|uniref:hypothetical protein n=1 Tax=Blautia sp. 1033sp1_1033st1_G9_1033SCRN_220408 TaxID=3144490 RepID=UPI0034A5263F
MQLALRLYYPIDADLIAIRLREKRRFTSLIRDKLIRLLDSSEKELSEKDIYHIPENIRKYVRIPTEPIKVNLNLTEGRDDVIIVYLQNVKPSVRSDTVKALFRMCLDNYRDDLFPIGLFLDNDKSCLARSSVRTTSLKEIEKVKAIKGTVPERIAVKKKNVVTVKETEKKDEIVNDIKFSEPDKNVLIKKAPTPDEENSFESETNKINTANSEIVSDKDDVIIIKDTSHNTDSSNEKSSLSMEAEENSNNTAYEMFSKLLGY